MTKKIEEIIFNLLNLEDATGNFYLLCYLFLQNIFVNRKYKMEKTM